MTMDQGAILRVGASLANPPFMFMQGGRPAGFEYDLALAIAEKLGSQLEVVGTSFHGAIPALEQRECDMVMIFLRPTPERRERVDFSEPYMPADAAILVKTGSPITRLADLVGKVIGVMSNTVADDVVKKIPGLRQVVTYQRRDRVFKDSTLDLSAGHVDAVIHPYPVSAYIVKNNPEFQIAVTIVTGERVAIAFPKGEITWRTRVNKALLELEGEGGMEALRRKWFDLETREQFQEDWRCTRSAET
ncbi:MAG: ABC transporter substrate-binding protein [Chloroflexi bacterium]|nr:ABC transporter substrate-binding protein [Chloroflexota bacterium]